MSSIKNIINASMLFAVILVVGFTIVGKVGVSAQELVQDDKNQQTENNQQSEGSQQSEGNQNNQGQSFNYVAQPGDSYSLMARKAIQTFGINNKVKLSEAQIIFAETNITKEAGSPVLVKGQKVEIKESTVNNWVDKAKKLTDQQQSAWNVYAKNANFNTNKVGQAS